MALDMQWFREQVAAYEEVRARYVRYADVLHHLLESAAARLAPLSIVQARAKSVPSFAEKILRKKDKYRDPVRQLTDLCGARVITHTKAEIQRICGFIREHFEIDEANSLDAIDRLRATEFGYRSVHYVVELKPGVFADVPEEVFGLKAEIQVRTIAQHAWADIGHDRLYKTALRVPDRQLRESARAAALLENADEAFARLVEEVDAYRTCYDAYLDAERMGEELAILEAVFEKDGQNQDLARRIARLAIGLEDWDKAIGFLEEFDKKLREGSQAPLGPPLRTCLGLAYCQKYRDQRHGHGYQQGRSHLEQVAQEHPGHLEAIVLLGDTWIGIDDRKALEWYRQAFQLDATHPAALAGYVALKIAEANNGSLATLFAPNIQQAIARCREQIEIGVNLPAAWYHMGELLALSDHPYESLAAYCKAISLTSGPSMLDNAMRPLERMVGVPQTPPELDWVRRLLRLAKAAKFAQGDPRQQLADLVSQPDFQIAPPVVIVAGGCDAAVEARMLAYRQLLADAFRDYRGTIISGGTTAGIPGLVGELGAMYRQQVCTIGYVPRLTPSHVAEDKRYAKLRRTPGEDFTALEPIQNWIDLVASGVKPADVQVLGINGGTIAAFEYRLALAMGARVGVLEDSGREAGTLIREAQLGSIEGLARLLPDAGTVGTFIRYGGATSLSPEQIEVLAQAIHERYRREQHDRFLANEPAMAPWPKLIDRYKDSNRHQAAHIDQKLAAIGMKAVAVADREIQLVKFTKPQVELLAEMEHARWTVERLLDGWTPGPRNPEKKTSPYLVAWKDLPPEVQEWDRSMVRAIPALLKKVGFEIQPL